MTLRIRNIDDPEELRPGSAEGLEWIGRPPTTAAIARVRDVLLIPSTTEGDWQRFPPVEEPVDLGRSLHLAVLDHDESELIMNACAPRGHYFIPVRQFGQLYSFVLDVPTNEIERQRFGWDTEGVIITALQLSRLVRDNGYTTEFAARVVDYDDGQKQIVPVGQHYLNFLATYRLREDRDWLTATEARELRQLLDAYWDNMDSLPAQLNIAISLSEGAVHQPTLGRALVVLFMGLEALLNTGKHQVTKQITKRMVMLAADANVDGVTGNFAKRTYEDRSSPAHGQELGAIAAMATKQGSRQTRQRTTDLDPAYMAKVARVQDLLRAATRKAIMEPSFAATFSDVESIRRRYAVTTLVGDPPVETEL